MSIQYAGGTRYNATFTCTVGTRAEIVTGIETGLTTAGWSTISGGGSGDVLLESATTAEGLVCRVRLHDPGSGSVANVYFRNVANTLSQATAIPLLTAAGKVYRVVANRYSFYVMTAGASAAREFCCGGVLYSEQTLQTLVTEGIWAHGNANGSADTTTRASFRNSLTTASGSGTIQMGSYFYVCNGSKVEGVSATNPVGQARLVVPYSAHLEQVAHGYRWFDDSLNISDPLIAWGPSSITGEAKIIGQLYDAMVVSDSIAADTTYTHDGNSWLSITNSNSGSNGVSGRGTLFVKIP